MPSLARTDALRNKLSSAATGGRRYRHRRLPGKGFSWGGLKTSASLTTTVTDICCPSSPKMVCRSTLCSPFFIHRPPLLLILVTFAFSQRQTPSSASLRKKKHMKKKLSSVAETQEHRLATQTTATRLTLEEPRPKIKPTTGWK